ncbi:MAG TPA: phage terminase small subunit P27 family [Stellaceae bacterium]|nr:phage terminase small subunit P27 family [Stellaceae bacterium]
MAVRKARRLKLIAGTDRADRAPRDDPATPDSRPPKPPKTLSYDAKLEWRKLAPAAFKVGTLRAPDVRGFELLCETLARARRAQALIDAEGMTVSTGEGGMKTHPAVRILEVATAQAAQLLRDFGLTPKGRQGVDATPPKGPNQFDRNGRRQ